MRDDSGQDIDPTIRNWVIRKYEDGASRSAIKAELEDEVDDLSVVDRIIDSGEARRTGEKDPELFTKDFLTMYKGAVRGAIGSDERFFRTVPSQSFLQSSGVMLANAAIVTAVIAAFTVLSAGFIFGISGAGIFTLGGGIVGIIAPFVSVAVATVTFAVIAHVLVYMFGKHGFRTTYNICADMTSLLFLAMIPIVGYFVWMYALVVFVRALEEAHGMGFVSAVAVTLLTGLAWLVVSAMGVLYLVPMLPMIG